MKRDAIQNTEDHRFPGSAKITPKNPKKLKVKDQETEMDSDDTCQKKTPMMMQRIATMFLMYFIHF